MTKTAGNMADQLVAPVENAVCHSAGIHHGAGQDKTRGRKEREGVYPGSHSLNQRNQRHVIDNHIRKGTEKHAKRNWHTQNKEHYKNAK